MSSNNWSSITTFSIIPMVPDNDGQGLYRPPMGDGSDADRDTGAAQQRTVGQSMSRWRRRASWTGDSRPVWRQAKVKNNEELALEPELLRRLYRIVMASVGHSEVFRSAVLPARVADFIFCTLPAWDAARRPRGRPDHGAGPRFRSDVSMTIFLNPPET